VNVLVTAAGGNVGSAVLSELEARNVPARAFDRTLETIEVAMQGVDRLFLACPNVPEQVEFEMRAIEGRPEPPVPGWYATPQPPPGTGDVPPEPTARPADSDFGQIHSSTDLARIVHGYDYLVLAAPLTNDTRGLVDAEVLAAMKPSARLINVGRGELVYTGALTEALASGSIAGAALDVVHPEPLPAGHALWSMENVIITPHMSGDTEDYLDDLGKLFVDNLKRFCNGEPLENVVDKTLGFVSTPEPSFS
jgi:hypothetical protein